MCDFILYFNDYVLHLCVINDDDRKSKVSNKCIPETSTMMPIEA